MSSEEKMGRRWVRGRLFIFPQDLRSSLAFAYTFEVRNVKKENQNASRLWPRPDLRSSKSRVIASGAHRRAKWPGDWLTSSSTALLRHAPRRRGGQEDKVTGVGQISRGGAVMGAGSSAGRPGTRGFARARSRTSRRVSPFQPPRNTVTAQPKPTSGRAQSWRGAAYLRTRTTPWPNMFKDHFRNEKEGTSNGRGPQVAFSDHSSIPGDRLGYISAARKAQSLRVHQPR